MTIKNNTKYWCKDVIFLVEKTFLGKLNLVSNAKTLREAKGDIKITIYNDGGKETITLKNPSALDFIAMRSYHINLSLLLKQILRDAPGDLNRFLKTNKCDFSRKIESLVPDSRKEDVNFEVSKINA